MALKIYAPNRLHLAPGPIWFKSWADALAAIKQMPALILTASAALAAMEATVLLMFKPAPDSWESEVLGFANAIAQGFVIAPVLIAVHRFVLLREITPRYTFRPAGRYFRFAGYATVFEIILEAAQRAPAAVAQLPIPEGAGVIVAAIIPFLILMFTAMCMVTLFPAIAIEAPGASWSEASRESIRHFWRLLFTLVATFLFGVVPLFCVMFLLSILMPVLMIPFVILLPVFFSSVFAAMASRLYHEFRRSHA
jgi:hypothetical protein